MVPALEPEPDLGRLPGYLIPEAEVRVIEGKEGVIGQGANGEVRRGFYRGAEVALKRLHMLRTDAAWVAEGGLVPSDLSPDEQQSLKDSFKKECDMLSGLVHSNIVLFVGVVIGAYAPYF